MTLLYWASFWIGPTVVPSEFALGQPFVPTKRCIGQSLPDGVRYMCWLRPSCHQASFQQRRLMLRSSADEGPSVGVQPNTKRNLLAGVAVFAMVRRELMLKATTRP